MLIYSFLLTTLANRFQVNVIYTDLTKAFDKVHHCMYRNWSVFAYVILCKSGVAQGSNLGPLLFIVEKDMKACKVYIVAESAPSVTELQACKCGVVGHCK